jgi:uncharacterized membrane protein YqgA involved in biofilm formation
MNTTLRNIIAVVLGIVIGGALNGGLISISSSIIPPPEGANLSTEEGLKAAMHLMQPKHFLFPFLAHALGTLVGAFVAAKFAASNKRSMALTVGIIFMLGGIYMVMILPSPLWFSLLDIIVAYIPMAIIGAAMGMKK